MAMGRKLRMRETSRLTVGKAKLRAPEMRRNTVPGVTMDEPIIKPWYMMYRHEMFSFMRITFFQSKRRSRMLAMVDGVQRLRCVKYSLKPSGAYV